YGLQYRLGALPYSRSPQGLTGVVTIPAQLGVWSTVRLDLAQDVAALWPDMADISWDHHFDSLAFGCTSRNGAAAGLYFANAMIARADASGRLPLDRRAQLFTALQRYYPSLAVMNNVVEVSGSAKHGNIIGGNVDLIDYSAPGAPTGDAVGYAVTLAHANGGIATVNHPFGVKQSGLSSLSTQDSGRRSIAGKYLANKLYGGADGLEVGYHERGGASLETLLKLGDTLSRNGLFTTYLGVSDNHVGTIGSWSRDASYNTFRTGTWEATTDEAGFLAAIRAGRVYCGEILLYTGHIWIEVDGNPMGSISVGSSSSRVLTVSATGLTSNSVVEVVTGPVDYSGSVDPGTAVVHTFAAPDLASGQASVLIDTSASCFVRINLYDRTLPGRDKTLQGRRYAFSNPIWLLRVSPPNGIPAARQAPDTA
ncbi:MAG: hypothetical protein QOJ23_2285, partial [Actinomycetota bacterium]|nr:hypothetical protein [Actinomycetota bacterium]